MSRPAELPYENTIHESLHITAVEVSPDRVILQMPVDHTVHQPMGILHGGASAVLAESAASLGAWMNCSPEQYVVGTDLNISHLRARRDGTVTATAEPIRKGRTMHVWHIEITDEDGKQVAVARCTLVVRNVSELQG